MENKHQGFDPIRHRDSEKECRLSEVKGKLVRNAERKLLSHLHKMKIEGAKITASSISALEIKEDLTSGAPLYTGVVTVGVSFIQGRQIKVAEFPVAVVESQATVAEEEVKKALDSATEVTKATIAADTSTVRASLKDFKIVDDGSKYLKVFHTAAYGDLEPIGAVSKAEYVECTDKSALLSAMFQDEAVSWPASVEFSDEFAEPVITEAAQETLVYKVKADASLLVVEAAQEDIRYKFKSQDTFRMLVEAEQNKMNELNERIGQRASVALADALRTRRIGNFKFKNIETSYDPESKTGKVTIQTELLDGKETKLVPLSVEISDTSMTLPTQEQVTSLLKETKVVESAEAPAITAAEIDSKLKRQALNNAPLNTGYQEVLRMPKDFLPASLKMGDVIEADGLRYKLVSKSENQLSNEKDSALYWTFERVNDVPESGPVFKVQN